MFEIFLLISVVFFVVYLIFFLMMIENKSDSDWREQLMQEDKSHHLHSNERRIKTITDK